MSLCIQTIHSHRAISVQPLYSHQHHCGCAVRRRLHSHRALSVQPTTLCTHCTANHTVHSLYSQPLCTHCNTTVQLIAEAKITVECTVIVQLMHTKIQSLYSQCSPCSLVSLFTAIPEQPIQVLRGGCWQRLSSGWNQQRHKRAAIELRRSVDACQPEEGRGLPPYHSTTCCLALGHNV